MVKNNFKRYFFLGFCLLIGLIIISGCKEKQSRTEPEVEIFNIAEECTTDRGRAEECCNNDCVSFCINNKYRYFKHHLNGNTCACWCS
jgi:hypothetical protein